MTKLLLSLAWAGTSKGLLVFRHELKSVSKEVSNYFWIERNGLCEALIILKMLENKEFGRKKKRLHYSETQLKILKGLPNNPYLKDKVWFYPFILCIQSVVKNFYHHVKKDSYSRLVEQTG